MSYILDALKKSEQDRGNGAIPSAQTVHSSSLNYHQEKRPIWPWLLIAALIINVAILVYFLKPNSNTESMTTSNDAPIKNISAVAQQNTSVVNNNPAPVIPTEITTPITEIKAAEQTVSAEDDRVINSKTNTTVIPQASTPVVDIDELPANIRRQIPGMVFSAHVYSTDPMQRSLVINNHFMEEGHAVSRDLTLIEITPNGAIFDFGGYRFSTGILSGWSTH